jgi:hypothetical protein
MIKGFLVAVETETYSEIAEHTLYDVEIEGAGDVPEGEDSQPNESFSSAVMQKDDEFYYDRTDPSTGEQKFVALSESLEGDLLNAYLGMQADGGTEFSVVNASMSTASETVYDQVSFTASEMTFSQSKEPNVPNVEDDGADFEPDPDTAVMTPPSIFDFPATPVAPSLSAPTGPEAAVATPEPSLFYEVTPQTAETTEVAIEEQPAANPPAEKKSGGLFDYFTGGTSKPKTQAEPTPSFFESQQKPTSHEPTVKHPNSTEKAKDTFFRAEIATSEGSVIDNIDDEKEPGDDFKLEQAAPTEDTVTEIPAEPADEPEPSGELELPADKGEQNMSAPQAGADSPPAVSTEHNSTVSVSEAAQTETSVSAVTTAETHTVQIIEQTAALDAEQTTVTKVEQQANVTAAIEPLAPHIASPVERIIAQAPAETISQSHELAGEITVPLTLETAQPQNVEPVTEATTQPVVEQVPGMTIEAVAPSIEQPLVSTDEHQDHAPVPVETTAQVMHVKTATVIQAVEQPVETVSSTETHGTQTLQETVILEQMSVDSLVDVLAAVEEISESTTAESAHVIPRPVREATKQPPAHEAVIHHESAGLTQKTPEQSMHATVDEEHSAIEEPAITQQQPGIHTASPTHQPLLQVMEEGIEITADADDTQSRVKPIRKTHAAHMTVAPIVQAAPIKSSLVRPETTTRQVPQAPAETPTRVVASRTETIPTQLEVPATAPTPRLRSELPRDEAQMLTVSPITRAEITKPLTIEPSGQTIIRRPGSLSSETINEPQVQTTEMDIQSLTQQPHTVSAQKPTQPPIQVEDANEPSADIHAEEPDELRYVAQTEKPQIVSPNVEPNQTPRLVTTSIPEVQESDIPIPNPTLASWANDFGASPGPTVPSLAELPSFDQAAPSFAATEDLDIDITFEMDAARRAPRRSRGQGSAAA